MVRRLILAARLAFVLATLCVALPSTWIVAAIVASLGAPLALSAGVALLLFPLLPLVVAALALRPRPAAPGEPARPRRVPLGLAVLGLAALLGGGIASLLVTVAPGRTFDALARHGDFMLRGRSGPAARGARHVLLLFADRLERWTLGAPEHPFAAEVASDPARPPERRRPAPPPVLPNAPRTSTTAATATIGAKLAIGPEPEASIGPAKVFRLHETREPEPRWPLAATVHPAAKRVPDSIAALPLALGGYFAAEEPSLFLRAKAIHDFVALRLEYDVAGFAERSFGPQDPESVLAARRAVCQGYAETYRAIAEAAGLEVAYIVGRARPSFDEEELPHAWNAVRIDGRWWLVDVTWDSAEIALGQAVAAYRTDYLFTPPGVFGIDHLPDDPRWQLREPPLGRAAFLRQPGLHPAFFAEGLAAVTPLDGELVAREVLELELMNPKGLSVIAEARPVGEGAERRKCKVDLRGERARIVCPTPFPGAYRIDLFAHEEALGRHPLVGTLAARRP